jgi:hypothetical protein
MLGEELEAFGDRVLARQHGQCRETRQAFVVQLPTLARGRRTPRVAGAADRRSVDLGVWQAIRETLALAHRVSRPSAWAEPLDLRVEDAASDELLELFGDDIQAPRCVPLVWHGLADQSAVRRPVSSRIQDTFRR